MATGESNSHSPPSPLTIITSPSIYHHDTEWRHERRDLSGCADGDGALEREAAPPYVKGRAGLYVAFRREKPPPALAPPDPVRAEGNADPGGASPQPPALDAAATVLPGAGPLDIEAPVGGGPSFDAAVAGRSLSGGGAPRPRTTSGPDVPALPLLQP